MSSTPDGGTAVNVENYEQALASFRAVMRYGEVYELRVPGRWTGYANDPETAARFAVQMSAANRQSPNPASGIYATLNPMDPALAEGRLNQQPEQTSEAAGNADVTRRRHLLFDVDPVRAEGHDKDAATDAERDAALAVRDRVRAEIVERGGPEPVVVTMSGNGGGLLYRLNEPNTEETTRRVKGALQQVRDEFDTEAVHIDVSVGDPARITKIPGTVSCKGPNTEERPWRVATAEVNPDAGTLDLSLLAGTDEHEGDEGGSAERAEATAQPIRRALGDQGIGYTEQQTDKGGIKLHLDRCPTGDHAKGTISDTTILIRPNGRPGFSCLHNTCEGKTWKDAKEALGMGAEEKVSAASQLLGLVEKAGAVLFHDSLGVAYATLPVRDHRETHAIDSATFRQWLRLRYHDAEGKPAGAQAIADVVATLEAHAKFDGPEREACVRIAHHAETDTIYLDLVNEAWEAVEIDRDGWRVTTNSPVPFRRSSGMLPLPTPEQGGSLERIREFINDGGDDDNYRLAVAWPLSAFHPTGPYPVLNISGEPGSAKSTTLSVLRRTFDPNVAMLRQPPKDEEALIIAAMNSRVVTADNVHSIPRWQSDAFCRLSTGGGIGKRSLYTNFDEVIADVKRPVGITGIGEIGTEADLMERSLLLKPPALSESGRKRLTERELSRKWTEAHPAILGALLDRVS